MPEGDICPRAQNVPSGLGIFDFVIIFQVGGGFRKAQTHFVGVFFRFRGLKPHHFITQVVPADSKPV
jgi:hypothetical protein